MAARIPGAGRYTQPGEGTTHWVEHLRSHNMSVGTYSVTAEGTDDQVPHTEDEVYVITAGHAWLVTPSGALPVGPGDAIGTPFIDLSDQDRAHLSSLAGAGPPGKQPRPSRVGRTPPGARWRSGA